MICKRLEPQGFCGGVKYALRLLDMAIKDETTPRPIYLIGNIIHNKTVMDEYKKHGVIILNPDINKTKLDLINSIDGGTVIFSAHGTSKDVIKRAMEKGLNIIDTICPNVRIVHNRIKSYLADGYFVIYIGTKGHPECEGALAIDSNIKLVTKLDDLNSLSINNDKIYVTNQTTLSLYDLAHIFDGIKEKYPNAVIDNKICTATTERQKAVMNQEYTDLCIIVGDKSSSNSNKLYKIATNRAKKAIFCESIKDLDLKIVKESKSISITSGASTPDYLVDEIINYIEGL